MYSQCWPKPENECTANTTYYQLQFDELATERRREDGTKYPSECSHFVHFIFVETMSFFMMPLSISAKNCLGTLRF